MGLSPKLVPGANKHLLGLDFIRADEKSFFSLGNLYFSQSLPA